mgnify:CR=1 FL=1
MSFFECDSWDDILFYLLSFPLHSLQYFSLVLINAYLFVQK